ncbi:hypothetical protein HRG84_19225 [Flavisolibacter sp. BT320]|nr:hypothetical protein [Flavisolibacter longurius]
MVGLSIPHYALDTALHKLVRAGHKVGLCNQLEEPKKTQTGKKRRFRPALRKPPP